MIKMCPTLQLVNLLASFYVGYFFALVCLTYALSAPFIGLLTKIMARRYVTCCSFFIATIALFMFGPSKLLGFGKNLAISTVGLGLLGVGCSVIFVPLLSEIIEGVQEKENIGESAELNDKAAGLFNTSYAIGCIIAPILGGFLNEKYGFETTCDIMACSSFAFGVFYFLFRVVPGFFIKPKPKLPSMVESPEKI